MSDYKKKIHDWLKCNQSRGVTLLKKLVQEKSIQGSERSAQAVIIEKCRELGLFIDIWEPGGTEFLSHKAFVSPRTNFKESPNVVAVLKGKGEGRSLILNGHIDVVPEGERNQWKKDPYLANIENGRLYGRGSTDMKGGSVSLLLAMEAIIESSISLKGDVIFQSVIEEESGGAGTLAAILRGYKADGAIIPEPTNMKIFPKQQGSLWFRIVIEGKAAHGGTRYEGVSAIEKSIQVLKKIEELERERNRKVTDPLYKEIPIPYPINVGSIQGGNWPSSVPDKVTLEGRMGVAPEETIEDAKKEMQSSLEKLKEIDLWFEEHPVQTEWWGARWLPGSIDGQHPLMKSLSSSYYDVLRKEPIVEASPWGTDAGLLTNIGNIPSIVFGPGTTEVAHYPNEYIEIQRMFEAAEIIALTIVDWCGVNGD